MVKIEETTDEFFRRTNAADTEEWEDDDDDASDVSSVASSEDDEPLDETLAERLSALKDIVPPGARSAVTNVTSTVVNTTWGIGALAGRAAWVLTTSALLVGLPFALAVEDEARFSMQERELNAQQSGAAMLGGSGAQQGGAPQVPAGQQPQEGLRPPGF